jgi:TusA-related sulfurtransferase
MTNKENRRIVEYDIRGEMCPSCLLRALKEVNAHTSELKQGEVLLHILTDHRQSTATIPDAVKNMGYDVEITKEQGGYRIVISSAARS